MERFTNLPNKSSKAFKIIEKKIENIESNSKKNLLRVSNVYGLVDDFYSHVLDWVSQGIIYASRNKLMLYDYYEDSSNLLFKLQRDSINAVKASDSEMDVCLGTNNGSTLVYDMEKGRKQSLNLHSARIGVVEWVNNNTIISGSRDKTIKICDLRAKEEFVGIKRHRQEVCGLKINMNSTLLASGGNDNKLVIHDLRYTKEPIAVFNSHKAAVKAISWSKREPYHLISGGGTLDKTIKLWDVSKVESARKESEKLETFIDTVPRVQFKERISNRFCLSMVNNSPISNPDNVIRFPYRNGLRANLFNDLNFIDVKKTKTEIAIVKNEVIGAQICNLYWTLDDEIISTQGYSHHDIRVYDKNLNFKKLIDGHQGRVIHFAMSKDERMFVTGSHKNKLFFWSLKNDNFGDKIRI